MGATQKPNPCQNSFKKRQKLCGTNEKKKAKYTISCIVKCTCLVWHVCAFTCIFAQATLRCVTICSLLWKIFRKRRLKTNPVEWKIKASYTYLHLWGKQQEFCFSSRWTPRPDTAAYSQTSTQTSTHTNTRIYMHTHTHTQQCNEKRKDTEEKNLDPSGGLCVGTGEQFVLQNSHYQHSAAGLQLAGVEHSVAQPNERLIFLPFC